MKYLTVALLHPRVLKGGAQYVAKDLHDTAAASPGWDAVLLAGVDGQAFPQYTRVGAAITALPNAAGEYILTGGQFDYFSHLNYDARRLKVLRRFLEDQRPDIIHVHHSMAVGLEFLELARACMPDATLLYTLHEYVPICAMNGQLYRYHERAICTDSSPDQCASCVPGRTMDEFSLRERTFKRHFELVDHFIAPSEFLRQRYISWGIEPNRITTIPNGHRQMRRPDWMPGHSSKVSHFGYFGQHVDAKGVDVLIEAAGLAGAISPEAIHIKIFGGSKRFATEAYARKLDGLIAALPSNVTVTEMGPYSRENVFDLMSGIDWVVVPSVWPETFALVVSEARDAKRPVIASRAGGLSDRIRHRVDGLQFTPGSANALADIISECAGNIPLWQALSDGAKDEVSLTDAWARHAELAASLRVRKPARRRLHLAK